MHAHPDEQRLDLATVALAQRLPQHGDVLHSNSHTDDAFFGLSQPLVARSFLARPFVPVPADGESSLRGSRCGYRNRLCGGVVGSRSLSVPDACKCIQYSRPAGYSRDLYSRVSNCPGRYETHPGPQFTRIV